MFNTMRAIRIHKYGDVDQLSDDLDAPIPACKLRDVLIRCRAVAVNPTDIWVREGRLRDFLNQTLPVTMGWDVSGVVESVGEQVTLFKPGDEVFCRQWTSDTGTFADFVAVPESHVSFKPKNIPHEVAAAVPLSAQTAWGALFEVGLLEAGQRVLIHAAAGGIGSFAIQLAKERGAYVIGTASGKNQDYVLGLGADQFLDYHQYDKSQPTKLDLVIDNVGESVQELSMSWLKPGGMIVSLVVPPSQSVAAKYGVTAKYALPMPDGIRLTAIKDLIEQNRLKVHVQEVMPLSEVKRAHQLVEAGHVRGKIVLTV